MTDINEDFSVRGILLRYYTGSFYCVLRTAVVVGVINLLAELAASKVFSFFYDPYMELPGIVLAQVFLVLLAKLLKRNPQ